MQELDFTFGGLEASAHGIKLSSPVSFSAAVPKVQKISIPGKDGYLHINEGAYNARTGIAKCFAVDISANVTTVMADVMAFLFATDGYKQLQTSDDLDHYWYARVNNAGEISARLSILNPFTIEFECKPFRYTNDAETIIDVETGIELDNPTGFKAYPVLYVNSTGTGAIQNENGSIEVLNPGNFIIDCEDWRCTSSTGESLDYLINSDHFLYLPIGLSTLFISGDLTVRIAPRWRTL